MVDEFATDDAAEPPVESIAEGSPLSVDAVSRLAPPYRG